MKLTLSQYSLIDACYSTANKDYNGVTIALHRQFIQMNCDGLPFYKGKLNLKVAMLFEACFAFFKIDTFSSQHFQITKMLLNVLALLQDANVVINSPEQFYSKRYDRDSLKTWFHIVQLQWLGFDYDKRDNATAMKEFISWIIPQ